MNKMHGYFKYVHLYETSQLGLLFSFFLTQFGLAKEFCFTVVLFKYTPNYRGCRLAIPA